MLTGNGLLLRVESFRRWLCDELIPCGGREEQGGSSSNEVHNFLHWEHLYYMLRMYCISKALEESKASSVRAPVSADRPPNNTRKG